MARSFIQTLTMVDIATGWTECLLLVTRDSSLVAEVMKHAQSLFPWLLRGVGFDKRKVGNYIVISIVYEFVVLF